MVQRVGHLIWTTRVGNHIFLVALLLGFSLILKLPSDTFASPSFAVMAALASEDVWSYILLACAMFGLMGLITPSPPIRRASLVLIATAHGMLATALWEGAGRLTTGVSTYSIVAAFGYFTCWLRWRD